MSPTDDLFNRTCADINAAYERLCKDKVEIDERYAQDWLVRDHEIRVRRAQYVLEIADLERMRMSLIRNMATMKNLSPMSGFTVDGR